MARKIIYGTPGCPNPKCNHIMMELVKGGHFGEQVYKCPLCGKQIKCDKIQPHNPIYQSPIG